MTNYTVEFTYSEPRWGDVNLEAANAQEAREAALEQIEMSYPEALDIEITDVVEAKND